MPLPDARDGLKTMGATPLTSDLTLPSDICTLGVQTGVVGYDPFIERVADSKSFRLAGGIDFPSDVAKSLNLVQMDNECFDGDGLPFFFSRVLEVVGCSDGGSENAGIFSSSSGEIQL